MAKNKTGRPSWFKVFLHSKAMIDAVPDDVAGKAFKSALRYFETGEVEELDQLTGAVFAALKPHIDEAFEDFRRSVDTGRAGGQKRWSNEGLKGGKKVYPPYTLPIGVPTEAEAETEAETDAETELLLSSAGGGEIFVPPTVAEVKAYCDNNDFSFDPEYFVKYYEAKGWMCGSSPMKDWKAVADNWNRKDMENNGQVESKHNWTVGTIV